MSSKKCNFSKPTLKKYYFKNHKYHSWLFKTLLTKGTWGLRGFTGRSYQAFTEQILPTLRDHFLWLKSFHEAWSVHRATREGSTGGLTPPSTSPLGKWGRLVLRAGYLIWGIAPEAGKPVGSRDLATLCPHTPLSHAQKPYTCGAGQGVRSCVHGPSGLPMRRKTPWMLLSIQHTKLMCVLVYQQKII